MMNDLTDVQLIKFLLFQQFYYGNDMIYGRTKEINVYIEGSGAVIEKFYGILISNIELIRSNHHKEYLEWFNREVLSIEVDKIYDKFMKNYEILDKAQRNPQIISSILIGGLLMAIKTDCFNETLNEIKIILIENHTKLNKKIDPSKRIDVSEEFINLKMERLKKLFSLNNGKIGISYNLAFLKALSYRFDLGLKVYKKTKQILRKYIQEITELIY
ncbi:MAG: hypothetical protein ACTSWY_07495 [Promethearchaeota archaeon]